MNEAAHVLTLGGSGFVGSRLMPRFRASATGTVESLGSRDCDLTDRSSAHFLQDRLRPSTQIVFCSTIARLREDSLSSFHRNVAMAEHVALAVAEGRAGGLIFLSSIDVYGRPPLEVPLNECSPIDPAGYYGLSKFVSERILQGRLAGKLPLAILRLPGVFSLDEDDNSVLGRLFNRLRRNEPVELTNDGRQRRSYLHVDDLHAIITAIQEARWSGLLNVSSTGTHSIRDMTEQMRAHLGSTSPIDGVGGGDGDFDLQMDNSALRREFPDVALKSLDDRLRAWG